MNSDDLYSAVAAATGLSKADAAKAVRTALGSIKDALAGGDKVSLPGFGAFDVAERAARTGRNPQTGATIEIAASKGVRFKAGKGLKDAVNG